MNRERQFGLAIDRSSGFSSVLHAFIVRWDVELSSSWGAEPRRDPGGGRGAPLRTVCSRSSATSVSKCASDGGIIDTLGNKAKRNKVLMKVGLNPSQVKGDATDVLGSILKKTGGNKDKLKIAFQGEQLKLVEDLGTPPPIRG